MSDITTTLRGTRISVVAGYPNYDANVREALVGKVGTIRSAGPDSDGDVQIELDEALPMGGTIYYVREWTVLGATPEVVTPEVKAVLPKTHWESKLEDLIDAIYDTAASRGYQGLLAELFEGVDIPLRPSNRMLKVTGQRVVYVDATPVQDALNSLRQAEAGDAKVEVNRVLAEFHVTVPWPEAEGAEHKECYYASAEARGDLSLIPDEVLVKVGRAISLGGGARQVREYIERTVQQNPGYGLSLSCTYCN